MSKWGYVFAYLSVISIYYGVWGMLLIPESVVNWLCVGAGIVEAFIARKEFSE